MSFSALPVLLAFALNRCSVRFITTCRCILGFTPLSASLIFGLALVAILVKHPELYPCWLRRVDAKIMFPYELLVSLIFIEVGYCLWNSFEMLIFLRLPAFMEEHCSPFGDYYIMMVESPIGVSAMSNLLALAIFILTLHITRVCNFNLLFKKHGIHKFFADAGLTSKICKHHKCYRIGDEDSDSCTPQPPAPTCARLTPSICQDSIPKMLRSGKKIY